MITKANSADIDAIVLMNQQFHLDFQGFIWDTRDWIEENHEHFHVMRECGIVAAMCLIENCIETIAVNESMHGKGFGKQMIDHAKKQVRKNGYSTLYVNSFCVYELTGFYEKCGFKNIGVSRGADGYEYFNFSVQI